jgi:pimeloyl-ACP methyl ester carboxylesterase
MPVITIEGQKLHYYRHQGAGARAGTQTPAPLVLVHGAGGSLMHWPPELRRLPGYTIYAPDLPGHGGSAGPGRATLAAYAETVSAFAAALDLSPFALAGHSMGGGIAIEYALRFPERLGALVLVGTGGRLRVAPQILDGILQDFDQTTRLVATWAHGEAVDPVMLERYVAQLRTVSPALLHADFAASDAFDRLADLSAISVPTLVICGENDRMTPLKYSRALAAQIPAAQLVVIPNAGHMVQLERPQLVATAIAGFLRTLFPS